MKTSSITLGNCDDIIKNHRLIELSVFLEDLYSKSTTFREVADDYFDDNNSKIDFFNKIIDEVKGTL